MSELELVVNQEEKERNRKELEEKLKKMGIIEPWKLKEMLNNIIEDSSKWEIGSNFPVLTIGETQLIENSLIKKESLCIELQDIESEIQRLNSRYALVKQEISNINHNVCNIQGHRLSNEIELDEEINSDGRITGIHEYRRCFICGKEVREYDLKEKDVVVKMKHRI